MSQRIEESLKFFSSSYISVDGHNKLNKKRVSGKNSVDVQSPWPAPPTGQCPSSGTVRPRRGTVSAGGAGFVQSVCAWLALPCRPHPCTWASWEWRSPGRGGEMGRPRALCYPATGRGSLLSPSGPGEVTAAVACRCGQGHGARLPSHSQGLSGPLAPAFPHCRQAFRNDLHSGLGQSWARFLTL